MAERYIPLFLDFNETTQDLTDEECGRLIRAIIRYANGEDTEPLLQGAERIAFRFLKGNVDRNIQLSRTRAKAGSKGGSTSKPKQAEAKGSKNPTKTKTEPKTKTETDTDTQPQYSTKSPAEPTSTTATGNAHPANPKNNTHPATTDSAKPTNSNKINTTHTHPPNHTTNTTNTTNPTTATATATQSFLPDTEAAEIQHGHDRVLEAAQNAGFKSSPAERAGLLRLCAEYGPDKTVSGIGECVRHAAPTLAYLEAVLKGTGKKNPRSPNNYQQRDYTSEQDAAMERMMTMEW